MSSREYKYLKGDKIVTGMFGVLTLPAKHYFMQRRITRYTTEQYIRWKHQQVIQQDLNDKLNPPAPREFAKSVWVLPEGGLKDEEGIAVPPIEYYMPKPADSHHTGFYLPGGAHVLGDPNMDNTTVEAINAMIVLAKKKKK